MFNIFYLIPKHCYRNVLEYKSLPDHLNGHLGFLQKENAIAKLKKLPDKFNYRLVMVTFKEVPQ